MALHFGLPSRNHSICGNVSENLKKFKQKFTNHEIATGINTKESATRVATLLTVTGNDAVDVFNSLPWDSEGDDKKIDKIIEKLEEFCEPRKNISYERYKFFSRAQKSGETIDQYVTVLRKLSESCELSTLKNSLNKDRIALGISDTKTRERLLRISDLTLEKAIDMVRSAEATEIQLRHKQNDLAVHGIGVAKKKPPYRKTSSANEDRSSSSKIFDWRNFSTRHGVKECPAYGKTCHNCKKQHHFQSICWSQKKVHGLMAEEEEENDCESPLFVGAVTTEVPIQNDECYVTLQVQGHLMRLKVDTGSQVNIIPCKELKKNKRDNPQKDLCN